MKKTEKSGKVSTYLGINASIEGIIDFSDTIRLDGNVKGRIISAAGTVIIGEKAIINADIEVDVAIVKGEINGSLEARDRIEISPPARITGDIQAPVILIETGVIFNGNCSMKGNKLLSGNSDGLIDPKDDVQE
ncbi:MAG: polymer-forming cytoskeletal protein [Deltaproteobacteria bacterium]|nr:polymer-forming cytoskeletal protein [Deltaproteobacteria bacterium]